MGRLGQRPGYPRLAVTRPDFRGKKMSSATQPCLIIERLQPEGTEGLYKLCRKENWSLMGKADMELHYSEGFYCGKIDGEIVSYLSAVLFGEGEYCVIAFYLVEKEHRGKGYGIQTWDHVWSMIADKCKNIALLSAPNMVHKYEKYGFKSAWTDFEWEGKAEKALSLPVPSECSDLVFTSYQEHDFDDLLKYDASVFGYSREPFLKKLRSFPQWEGWVVSTPSGKIVGYCVVKISPSDHIHSLAPWYANDANIARALLNKAAAFLVNKFDSPIIDSVVPTINKEGLKLANMLRESTLDHVRMFTENIPKIIRENCETRVFGISSPATG